MQIVQETPNLWRLTRLGMVNCFLVREGDGGTLVDANLPGSAKGILAAVGKLGLPIRRILLTHAHFDHVGAVDALCHRLSGVELVIGQREARLLQKDFSLDVGETGKKLFGFPGIAAGPTRLLEDGDRVGALRSVFSPGHTPGHMAYLDERDGTLMAGDSYTTQLGVTAAGAFRISFPMAALFAWNKLRSAESAKKLLELKPTRLAVGHGRVIESPYGQMKEAVELAFRQCVKVLD